jgi:hypothetical protein
MVMNCQTGTLVCYMFDYMIIEVLGLERLRIHTLWEAHFSHCACNGLMHWIPSHGTHSAQYINYWTTMGIMYCTDLNGRNASRLTQGLKVA